MLSPLLERRIAFAESVAESDKAAASLCTSGQEALRARLVQNAKVIEELVALLKSTALAAKLNHNTIQGMQHERADFLQAACAGEGPDCAGGSDYSRPDDARSGLEPL